MKRSVFGVLLFGFPVAFAFDGSEMDAILPIIQTLITSGVSIVIAIGVYYVGVRVFRLVTNADGLSGGGDASGGGASSGGGWSDLSDDEWDEVYASQGIPFDDSEYASYDGSSPQFPPEPEEDFPF